ncbi:MAG TPA: alpha-amylase family glycosyl hydrolase [Eudoraea sp.]|nr:alpha-amylase family glycosyl hydrolase [Eudoraea sp.]
MRTSLFLILLTMTTGGKEYNQGKAKMEATGDTMSYLKPRVPDWHKNATIYEVNLRHFTPEGTFRAFEAHIPRLKEMGMDILWFMPINPVSVKNRKGELGSPYAAADYYDTNPDFGTMDDFRHMMKAVQDAGMYVIIDWVPNHTGWDHTWITEHPDWYTKDKDGNITDPINAETGAPWGWTDVADLNYDNPEMRQGMIEAMAFWIRDVGIDGFRVDVAHGVPVDFWEECSDALYAIEPVFMLSEGEVPAIVNNGAFVMDYAWSMHSLLNKIAMTQGVNSKAHHLEKGNVVEGKTGEMEKKTALDIDKALAKRDSLYHRGYQMQFTSNHDENAWAGTEFQRFGEGHLAFAVLVSTFDGMPLVYSGQESAVDMQYNFFKKDEINWGDYQYAGFYKTLFDLKHRNKAIWNGEYGGKLVKIPTGTDENVYAFIREKEGDKVVAIINLSGAKQKVTLEGASYKGGFTDIFSGEKMELNPGFTKEFLPWEYLLLANEE